MTSKIKGYLSVCGTACVYFAMGLYFSSGNTAVYLTSYLRYHSKADVQLSDSIWFLAAVGLSALILPFGGMLYSVIGLRAVCLIGGLLQSVGILSTYFALETTFPFVVICYGGSFLLSCGICYTPPLANINKWFPDNKGLVTGVVAAAMASAPTLWTPLITTYVNPNNISPDANGYFIDLEVLSRSRQSMLLQGFVTLILFIIGVILLFPAPTANKSDKESFANNSVVYIKKEVFNQKMSHLSSEEGLTPRQVIATKEFILLSTKIMLTELVFFYLLFVYKPFGQTFISDDLFLSFVGASAAVCNMFCRIVVGHIKDLTTYKICCIPLSCLATILVVALPLTPYAHRMVYAVCMVAAVGIVGSQYALMPSAVSEAFGEKFASINIGLVYMSTVIADIAGAFASQYLTTTLGWEGMIALVGVCAFIDFMITFLLPDNQRLLLIKRLEINKDNKAIKNKTNCVFPTEIVYNCNTNDILTATRRTSISKPSLYKTFDNTCEATRL
ncbi:oxalate:formate antiporter-like [Oppia nitens]|uniref:oxalate:formate antiporter-like n=1 Tax=Oppia nitens TaxID=1686743 RepID=UPI0023DB393B|nr:oxalate:formate antiporter-like [Oppia nitens]